MSTEHPAPDDADLRRAVRGAVDDVVPRSRLEQIHAAAASAARRRRRIVRGGALVAVAGVVAGGVGGALLARTGPAPQTAVDPAGSPDSSGSSGSPGSPGVVSPSGRSLTAVYLVGPGPSGPDGPDVALYRYFADAVDPLDLLTTTPADPDYRTLWAPGSLVTHDRAGDGVIDVTLGDVSTTSRPAGVTLDEARLAVQQVVYTLQAYYGERAPVRFLLDDEPAGQVLGIATPGPVEQEPPLDVLSHLSISDPAEGNRYDASFVARGVANGFEGTVACRLLDDEGADEGADVWQGVALADGGAVLSDRLAPWSLRVDLDGVAPGGYLLTCTTDDPTAGTEGRGADVDTRSITVE